MSTNQILSVLRGNDGIFALTLTYKLMPNATPLPLNITGMTLTAYVKASSTAADGSATTYTVSNGGLIITNTVLGYVTLGIPASANSTAGTFWWRIDAFNGTNATAMYGYYYVLAV